MLMPIHCLAVRTCVSAGMAGAAGLRSHLALVSTSVSLGWYLFVLCSLPLFHWAHRFRFTLYDGLQIKHLNEVINIFCYGGAVSGTAMAGYLLWKIP